MVKGAPNLNLNMFTNNKQCNITIANQTCKENQMIKLIHPVNTINKKSDAFCWKIYLLCHYIKIMVL